MRPRQVFHVNKLAVLTAVPAQRQRLAPQGLAHEDRDYEREPHSRAVGDPVAQDCERELMHVPVVVAEHFGRHFRGGVNVPRGVNRQRRGLVDEVAVDRRSAGVDPDRAGQDHAANATLAGGFQHP